MQLHLLPEKLQSVLLVRLSIELVRTFADNLFLIVLVLFLLDTLKPIEVGTAWAIFFIIQAALDFPTGNLGDTIGHKQVLILAHFSQIIAIPLLLLRGYFNQTVAIYVFMALMAVGFSQESGALEAWMDNKYQQLGNQDEDRSVFKGFQARLTFLTNLTTMGGFLSGGFISTFGSPDAVFLTFALAKAVVLLQIMLRMDNTKGTSQNYFGNVRKSFGFFLKSSRLKPYFIGIAILWAANESVWYTFMLFRIYREYGGGTDAGAGIIRGVVFLTGSLWQLAVIKLVHRFRKDYFWIFVASFISNAFFFSMVMLYYIAFTPSTFSLIVLAGFLLIYQIPASWESLQFVLQQRVNLDLIPDQYRNSLYSLLPTITRLLGIPMVVVTGFIVENYGFISSFYWLITLSILGSAPLGILAWQTRKYKVL